MKIRSFLRMILTFTPGGKWAMECWRRERKIINEKIKQHRLQKFGLEILNKVYISLLNKPNVIYHVDYGTLLGLIREKGFIKHDDDIDFSIYDGTITPNDLYNVIVNAGFEFLRGFSYNGIVTELAFTYKNVSVDFFFVYNDNDGNYSQIYNDFRSDKDCDRAYFAERLTKPVLTGINTQEFYGIKVNIPKNAEEFLRYNYGKGWAIPVKNWNRENSDIAKRTVLSNYAEIFYKFNF